MMGMGKVLLLGNGTVAELRGETGIIRRIPECPRALYESGDVVRLRKNKAVGHFPRELVVLLAIPPGFSHDDALADLMGLPRPLLSRRGYKGISYLLAESSSRRDVYSVREKNILRKVDHVKIEIKVDVSLGDYQ